MGQGTPSDAPDAQPSIHTSAPGKRKHDQRLEGSETSNKRSKLDVEQHKLQPAGLDLQAHTAAGDEHEAKQPDSTTRSNLPHRDPSAATPQQATHHVQQPGSSAQHTAMTASNISSHTSLPMHAPPLQPALTANVTQALPSSPADATAGASSHPGPADASAKQAKAPPELQPGVLQCGICLDQILGRFWVNAFSMDVACNGQCMPLVQCHSVKITAL